MKETTRNDEFIALGHTGSEHYVGLETFPNPGVFAAADVEVTLTQKARGGITSTATS